METSLTLSRTSSFSHLFSSLPAETLAAISCNGSDPGQLSSLLPSVSKRFSLQELGREIRENRYSNGSGDCYDERFVTFSYGGRIGMGRHTAIRYLKNSVENPKLHEMRLQKNRESPKFVSNELVSRDDDDDDDVFYKPVKIYAVRYLDEILVITSGSKMLTLDLKNWVLKYLEGRLELKVNTVKTAIHSAVSEKIDFIGMELQAVQPSVFASSSVGKGNESSKEVS
ncbi:hypothetical protein F8388_019598 [Cannabis sativa]|uniref:Reverse transcriptase domain-containing protein n=1 Tax=Cannabis sativa TaxID=3483 RepID=A0A7J6FF96_CANSA|nr:hypothetical protein F8388_019598 [Cannabis sativa]